MGKYVGWTVFSEVEWLPFAEYSPAVTSIANGRFAIAWQSTDNLNSSPANISAHIRARIFDATGTSQGIDFIVNSTAAYAENPKIAALGQGFVVTWESGADRIGDGSLIRARLFDENGTPQAKDFVVHSSRFFDQFHPEVISLHDGGFVVAWMATQLVGSDPADRFHLRARVFDANGQPKTSEFRVNSTRMDDPDYFPVERVAFGATPLADGGFVATWRSADDGDGLSSLIRARLFDDRGRPLGADFRVNSTAVGTQYEPKTTALPNGGFVVTWSSYEDYSSIHSTVRARIFDERGVAIGRDFEVSGFDDFNREPTVTTLADGDFIILWGGRARVFDDTGRAKTDIILVSAVTGTFSPPASLTALSNGGFVVADDDAFVGMARARVFDENGAPQGPAFLIGTPPARINGTAGNDEINAGATVAGGRLPTGKGDKIITRGGDDTVDGVGGNDWIFGGDGRDFLSGNRGNDLIKGDDGNDVLRGGLNEDNLKGGAGHDLVYGGPGNDRIRGGWNTDTLNGGTGKDWFVFDEKLSRSNVDRVSDFEVNIDRIVLDYKIFGENGLELGQMSAGQFRIGSQALDSSDRIIYNEETGRLYYDVDGIGRKDPRVFAILEKHLSLDHMDFFVFAFYA